jgi:phosphatidate cytidylyltransferase
MLLKRILVSLVLLPIAVLTIYAGGWIYAMAVGLLFGLSASEYSQLMRISGSRPAVFLVIGGVLVLHLHRQVFGLDNAHLPLSLLVLLSAGWHIIEYERGRREAATDFTVTLGGWLYLGVIGAFMISLRNLSNGLWWTFLVLVTVWAVDVGAYIAGTRWGRRLMSPRLSPKKTWVGFLGGTLCGLVCGVGLGIWFSTFGVGIPRWSGLVLGLFAGVVATLGDLSASLFKRQAGVKDSGNFLPGHGGIFDRVDSWIWMSVTSFYLIQWLWI